MKIAGSREDGGRGRRRGPRRGLMLALAAPMVLALTGCYYADGHAHGYGYGPRLYGHPHGYYPAPLKPKEKDHYGYGPHAGHPHGGPPGRLKKFYGHPKGHPHGGPPGQLKKRHH